MIFSLFDIVIITTIIVSSFLGLYRGFMGTLLHFISFLASIILSVMLYPYMKLLLLGHIENELVLSIVAGGASYIACLACCSLVVTKILPVLSGGGFVDCLVGLILGILRGCVFALSLFIAVAVFTTGAYLQAKNVDELILNLDYEKYPIWLQDSLSTEYNQFAFKRIVSLVPSEFLQTISLPDHKHMDKEEDIIEMIKEEQNIDASSVIIP